MSFITPFRKRVALLGALVIVASACIPRFWAGSSLELEPALGNNVRLIWNTAYDADYPEAGHLIQGYEVKVNGAVVGNLLWFDADCTLTGLASNTSYNIEVNATTVGGERSDSLPPALGTLSATYNTPAGSNPGGTITCVSDPNDPDGDRLPTWAETNTGIFVDKTNTGTDPNNADTDGDGINDGDEVTGTIDGLPLPQLGASPVKKNILMEFDWMDDTQTCGAHSHQPAFAAIDRFEQAFANSPVANPDGTTGIDVISDYGQTPQGVFNKGNLVTDVTPPIGSINGDVGGAEFLAIKAENFHPTREGFFHYVVMMHNYNTNSLSSGQAEVNGDDMIISLQCSTSVNSISNTIMHELGHNLSLRHGGDSSTYNYKPNYNSVMNYRYQFPGVDASSGPGSCDVAPNQIIDYSYGTRVTLNETSLWEPSGVCGAPGLDWNGNTVIDPFIVAADINNGDGLFSVLTDWNDWDNLNFGGVVDGDGAPTGPPILIDEQPIPDEYRHD